jgi:hypothetical protein
VPAGHVHAVLQPQGGKVVWPQEKLEERAELPLLGMMGVELEEPYREGRLDGCAKWKWKS